MCILLAPPVNHNVIYGLISRIYYFNDCGHGSSLQKYTFKHIDLPLQQAAKSEIHKNRVTSLVCLET